MNWWRRWTNWLKLAYAGAASALCVFLAALSPTEGPPLAPYIPAHAGLILHVQSGEELYLAYKENPILEELFADEELKQLAGKRPVEQALDEFFDKLHGNSPWYAKVLVPPRAEGLFPFAGREFAVVRMQPESNVPVLEKPKRAPLLIFTRVSGARGLVLRLAAFFSPKVRRQVTDLGGGLIAYSPDRVQPARPSVALAGRDAGPTHAALARSPFDPAPLFRLVLNPADLDAPPRVKMAVDTHLAMEDLRQNGVPESVLAAMLNPPGAGELLRVAPPPAQLRLDVFAAPGGGLTARGSITGALPVPPAQAGAALNLAPEERKRVFGEVLLPLDAKACFLRYLERRMRNRETERRWMLNFDDMHSAGVDIDAQLWPACGMFLHATLGEPPPEDATGYPLLQARMPFDGTKPEAHVAFGELTRAVCDTQDKHLVDGRVQGMTSKHLRRIFQRDQERYVTVYGQILAPEITVSRREIALTSNAGVRALMDDTGPAPAARAPWSGAAPNAWFVRLDGVRMAPYVERLTTKYYDDLEEDYGTRNFLDEFPDAQLRIRASKKLARAFGSFSMEVIPDGSVARIEIQWTPGTLKVVEQKDEDSAPPPPPPPPPSR